MKHLAAYLAIGVLTALAAILVGVILYESAGPLGWLGVRVA